MLRQGESVGNYRVVRSIDAGGAGEVYEALDPKLNRAVALKLLPNEQAVLREARAAAKLDHPNILTVHDVGVDQGHAYLVTELVRGKTLRELLEKAKPPLDIAVQIAAGLAAAHAAGIVHRDLKPENVMVTEDGTVKILDFGIARLAASTSSESETEERGISGTPGYMAPEQAEGKPVDHRADVFSFGCVLYEMLSGRKPFPDVVALVRDEPKPLKAPEELRKLVERMLRKDPERRLQSMADVPMFLREIRPEPKRGLWWLAAAVVLALVVSHLALRPTGEPTKVRTTVVTDYPGDEYEPALSPDGTKVAFPWRRPEEEEGSLYVKLIDGGEPLRIVSGGEVAEPTWSPDGQEIAFLRELSPNDSPAVHEIAIVSALGGPTRRAGTTSIGGHGLDWSPDGRTFVVSDRTAEGGPIGLFLHDIDSARRRPLTRPPDDFEGDLQPKFSPSGDRVAFIRRRVIDFDDVYVASLADGSTLRLTRDDRHATDVDWSPDGEYVLFASDRNNMPSLWKVSAHGGEPELVAAGAERATSLSVARTGERLVYRESIENTDVWRAPGPSSAAKDGPAHPFLTSSYENAIARYSPDGRKIVYQSGPRGRADLWVAEADGSSKHQLVFTEDSRGGSWSPDGRLVVYNSRRAVEVVSADGGIPRVVIEEGGAAAFSRDGRDIFFTTRRSGRPDVWKVPVEGGEPTQLTRNGGIGPLPSHDGRFVYYANEGRLWRVPVEGGEPELVVEKNIFWLRWTVWDDKLVYVTQDDDGAYIEMFDPSTRDTTQVVRLPEGRLSTGLSVSPDGEWILFARQERRSDLMMLEGFSSR